MPVPNQFANVTTSIPLSQLDANFNTPITLGNTAIQLGNTVSTLNNMTLANVTVTSGNVTITNVTVTTANVTTANIATAEIANVTVSGTGTFAAGSNTAPSITTSGDTNTGIFFPAADTIAFTEGGVESMRITSAGDVGIGTSSPTARLTVVTGAAGNNEGEIRLSENATYYAGLRRVNATDEFRIGSYGASQNITFYTVSSERMRLDASGNLLVGTTTASSKLTVNSEISIGADGDNRGIVGYTPSRFYIGTRQGGVNYFDTINVSSGNVGIGTTSPGGKLDVRAGTGSTLLVAADATNLVSINNYNSTSGFQDFKYAGSTHQFFTGTAGGGSVSERARITATGEFLVGKSSTNVNSAGFQIESDGGTGITRSGTTPLIINRLADDGTLIDFRQANTSEGSISVSGTTVSYNGGHLARWSQLLNGQRDESILKGTVLSNLDEMCEWFDAEGNPLPNEQLNRMKVSDVEGDTNVAGVFVNWDNDDQDNPYDMNIAMTGDMIIRIAQGITVQKGDLLMSAGDGTAKPQGDDIVRSKTVAKVTSNHVTCTYDDGSYCVPCVLMAC